MSLLSVSLLMNACQQTSNTTISEPTQETPSDETITGIATIGLFGGTEMGCEFDEDAAYGEIECNHGSGTIYLDTNDGKIYLKDYSCSATQFYVNDETGKHVEYRASAKCDEGIVIGENYSATGELTHEENVWRDGKQVDEQWLTVKTIVLAK